MKKLSRNEMKNVMGGLREAGVVESCGKSCSSSSGARIMCTKDGMGGCLKSSNCSNAVDCTVNT